ncbi:TonB-dependent receptor domain-containing protein [Glaciecola sp. 2405UD65-10]|uniref:TonB-dependent receptor domain-containing protein n=1 Tax=Glaciecola sp. 2405UD65-10 TaxID=3397244 RepID=UPI003B593E47
MKKNFKLNAVSAVVLASLFCVSAAAQEVDNEDKKKQLKDSNKTAVEQADTINDEEAVEVIEVSGFRGSVLKAINSKRFNDAVTDSIHAEDVGKSTDQNIADALSRITGVSVQEEAGEGTRISVRGAGPGQNQISINGIALTGGLSDGAAGGNGTANNSVDLSSFSADILSSIDVVKTAAADQDEGSLGANVNLKTLRPLSLNKPRRSFTVEGRYNEFADDNDWRANVSISDKFFDDSFGIIFTASHDIQNTRTDRINTNWEQGTLPISDLDLDQGRGIRTATDLATGAPIRVQGFQRDGTGNLILDDSGNPILNPISDLMDLDESTQRLVEGELNVLARDGMNFGLNTDQRKRTSLSTGLQWRPSDKTEIQLDITHTAQEILVDNQSLNFNMSPSILIHPDDDNTALNVVDLRTNTLVTSTSRSNSGGWNRVQGRRDLETNVATLDIEHSFTDNLQMNVLAGYSKSTDETPGPKDPERWLSISTATWGTTGRQIVEGQPSEILELVGYDCSQGSLANCDYFTGMTNAEFDAFDGTVNSVTSRFNPFDVSAMHLGGINFRQNEMTDENKSLFVNFDYALDYEHLTSFEFGAKWSNRDRVVNVQNNNITNGNGLVDFSDPDADPQSSIFSSIRVADFLSGEAFPYDNFGEDIDANRSHPLFGGWAQIDALRALELVAGKPAEDVGVKRSTAGSREISTETVSAYFKANFEFMDGKLTGNLGLRFVRDENASAGTGGIQFVAFPQLVDPYDLIVNRNLADVSQAPCPAAVPGVDTRYTPANDDQLRDCWAWQVTHAYNIADNNTIPIDADGNPVLIGEGGAQGIDVNRLLYVDANGNIVTSNQLPSQIYDQNGNLVNTTLGNWATFRANGAIWPWLDRSTAFTGPLGEAARLPREAISSGSNKLEMWLPSLSLNYALNDDTIMRLAFTKTMTRPPFDNLNPANNVRENQFNASTGTAGNALLENLTSNNVDFSYEWYFNESSLLSVALFHKDMKNFVETVTVPYHYKDVRTDAVLADANLLLDFDPNRTPGDEDNCMPFRQAAGFFDRWVVECDVANIRQVRNGRGQTITGLEFGYTQNYDFLPGQLSGLGLSVNYTYQDSQRDQQEIGTTGTFSKGLPAAYTPQHSGNATLFWEKDGIQMRLANRYTGEQLIGDVAPGAIWQESSNRLDFSASYKINKNFTLTFNALNLTDETRRNFLTASNTTDFTNPDDLRVTLDEGSIFDGNVTRDRTVSVYKSGRQFRMGIRGTF